MANNTIETVWKLILDEQSASKGANDVQRLAATIQNELGSASVAAIDKTTAAIQAQTDALKTEEEQADKTGDAVKSGSGGGKASELISKFGGVGRMAGINVEQIAGIARAAEGLQQVAAAAGLVEASSTAAAPGLMASAAGFAAVLAPLLPLVVAIGAVVAVLAALKSADDQRAKDLKEQADLQRAISDEIAAGATREDIEGQIEALQFRAELEKSTLEEGKKKYEDYIESVRNAAGGLGRFLEPIIRLFGGEENQLAANIEDSQKIIDDAAKKEAAYKAALDKGLTAKNDAKKKEEDLANARDKTAKATDKAAADQERAAEKAKADREKAAADAGRAAEQQAQKEQQAAQKRYDIQRQYGDKLVDIARKSADDALKLAKDARLKEIDNRRSFDQDMQDISSDFQDSEREEAIKRQEDEAADLRQHAQKLAGIRDDAFAEEKDLLNRRDFLGATRVAERANRDIEAENKAFKDGQDEKLAALKSEDAKQLRELDKARRERLLALQRANQEAQIQYKRDIDNQRDARRIAIREAGIDLKRSLAQEQQAARALIGIRQQTGAAELQIAKQVLMGIQSMVSGSITNNSTRTWNGDMNISTTQQPSGNLQAAVLKTLSSVGLTGQ